AAPAAVDLSVIGDRVRQVRGMARPIDVAQAGARGAGIAIAGAVGRPEPGADARVVKHDRRVRVAVRLARRTPRYAVVVIDAMPQLVQDEPRLFAARAAHARDRAIELQHGVAPIAVAGPGQVDVRGERRVEPGDARQPTAGDFLPPADRVIAGAG